MKVQMKSFSEPRVIGYDPARNERFSGPLKSYAVYNISDAFKCATIAWGLHLGFLPLWILRPFRRRANL